MIVSLFCVCGSAYARYMSAVSVFYKTYTSVRRLSFKDLLSFMKTNKPKFTRALALLMLWIASLACTDYGEIDPAIIAPQDLSNMDLSWKYMAGFDFSNKNLSGVNFSHATLYDANFTNCNCQKTIFDNASLMGANFSGAILDEKWALIIEVLTSGSGANKNLAGYDFSEAYMGGYDFSGANLQGADFRNANLAVVNFRGADLSGAIFSGAGINGKHGADFSYANLTNATISSWQLKQAILGCTILPDGTISGVFIPKDNYATPDIAIVKDKLCTENIPAP